ncbi:hypothetical protein ACOMHN_065567 [Nucella lapillus]
MDTVFCDYCQNSLSGLLIRCAECSDFDLCLECFSSGVECGEHRKEHKYRVENVQNSHVFENKYAWNLTEEHKLLDAVEEFGFGNWAEVSGHVKTRKPEDCEEHFSSYYVTGNIGKATFPPEASGHTTDLSCPVGGPVSPASVQLLPPLELTLQEQQELGFMPLRNDFEREYNNAAEGLISGLSINNDDDDLDIDVKLTCLSKYRMQLHERVRWKRLARSHRLISSAFIPSKNGKTPNAKRKCVQEDGEVGEKVKVFTQLQTSVEHERLQEVLSEETELKTKVDRLSECRRQGLTVLSQDVEIEETKYRRNKPKQSRKKRVSCLGLPLVGHKLGKVEKLDIRIDDEGTKDDEGMAEDSREMAFMPGYNGLSEKEKQLCNSLKMVPESYMRIKSYIIDDILKSNGVTRKLRFPSDVDRTHRRRILGFFSEHGWIGVM